MTDFTNHNLQISLQGLEGTEQLARKIAPNLRPGDCLLLGGGLGAGKTSFAFALAKALGVNEIDISSPSFALQHIYPVHGHSTISQLIHMDLYRLEDVSELEILGLDEYFSRDVCIVEWPERLEEYIPEDYIHMGFSIFSENERNVTFYATGAMQPRLLTILSTIIEE